MRVLLLTLTAAAALHAEPPKINPPDAATRSAIDDKVRDFERALAPLSRKDGIEDAEVFLRAVLLLDRHREYYGDAAKAAPGLLDEGMRRLPTIAAGGKIAPRPGVTTVIGYRSRIDGAILPVAITVPHESPKGEKHPVRVVWPGRDEAFNEALFLLRHGGRKPAPKGLGHIVIHVYGRGNVGPRWSNVSDLSGAQWEATFRESLADYGQTFYRQDHRDVPLFPLGPVTAVARRSSTAEAATWQPGLLYPGGFRALGPGFDRPHGPPLDRDALPPHQRDCLSIHAPEDDPPKSYLQWLASEVAGPAPRGPAYPNKLVLTTRTMKYASAPGVTIGGLERHYRPARVELERKTPTDYVVRTKHVRSLILDLAYADTNPKVDVLIDGQRLSKLEITGWADGQKLHLQKGPPAWHAYLPGLPGAAARAAWPAVPWRRDPTRRRLTRLEKVSGQQGPIDDAFTAPFVCVRGAGKPFNPAVQAHAEASLERFRREWSKYMRGDVRIVDDKDVTPDDVGGRHLILFGDPGSNSLLAKALPALPLKWTKEEVTWRGKAYDAATHVPVLIYPWGGLNGSTYVVVNSGHTFHEDAFRAGPAHLYPRLGDHALLRLTDPKKPLKVEVVEAGLFDEFWRFRAP